MRFRHIRATYGAALAFMTIAFVGGWAIDRSAHNEAQALYRGQIAACERNNQVRRESNNRIPAHEADTKVLHDFLVQAAAARNATWRINHLKSDKLAAHQWLSAARLLEAKVHFNPVHIVNCDKVVPRP